MRIKDLKPNPKNPRKMSADKLTALSESLKRFGDLSGFVYNRRSKLLLGGHQKQKVIPPDSKIVIEKKYDQPTSAMTVAEGYVEIDGERFKYREVDADKSWETEAMIAANGHSGEWDKDLLKINLAEIKVDLPVIGFEMNQIKAMGIDIPKPVFHVEQREESDEEYVKNTPQTEEQIPTDRPDMSKAAAETKEQTEVAGKRHVIIIDCGNLETKKTLREKFEPEILAAGAKIF